MTCLIQFFKGSDSNNVVEKNDINIFVFYHTCKILKI